MQKTHNNPNSRTTGNPERVKVKDVFGRIPETGKYFYSGTIYREHDGLVWEKSVKSAWYFRNACAWGIDRANLIEAIEIGVQAIRLIERDYDRRVFICKPSDFFEHGISYNNGKDGAQRLLELKYFSINGAPPSVFTAKPQAESKLIEPRTQLKLFEEELFEKTRNH